jgi:hypothetical protein
LRLAERLRLLRLLHVLLGEMRRSLVMVVLVLGVHVLLTPTWGRESRRNGGRRLARLLILGRTLLRCLRGPCRHGVVSKVDLRRRLLLLLLFLGWAVILPQC